MRVLSIFAMEDGGVTKVQATLTEHGTWDTTEAGGYRLRILVPGAFVPPNSPADHRQFAEAVSNIFNWVNAEIHCEHEDNSWCTAVHDGGVGTDIGAVIERG